MTLPHAIYILFLFALGSCVGSFLNVVVWRLPRIEHDPNDRSLFGPMLRTIRGLSHPPSHCPKCNERLKWYDNLPVIGWIKLGGKCRYCRKPISIRYPIVEAIVGLLFVFYYVMFFIMQIGPCAVHPTLVPDMALGAFKLIPRPMDIRLDWAIYLLDMAMIAGLLASSLIDAAMFIIPVEIPWFLAATGIIVHTLVDKASLPGALNANPAAGALAAGGSIGLIISIFLWHRGIIPQSFPEGEPMQDIEPAEGEPPPVVMNRRQLNHELRKEMMFLLPPMVLSIVCWLLATHVGGIARFWDGIMHTNAISGLLGAALGALVGAFVVWITRILGTLGFGRLAMGLGDVHLMFGVGAIIGAGGATVAFFLAPFFGIAVALYMLFTGTRRELPYGPYLSLASGFVLLYGCPILAHVTQGMSGISLFSNNASKSGDV